MAMCMPGKGLFEATSPPTPEKEPQDSPPLNPSTLHSKNLKSNLGDLGSRTGYEILEMMLNNNNDYGGAKEKLSVREHRSRIRTGVT